MTTNCTKIHISIVVVITTVLYSTILYHTLPYSNYLLSNCTMNEASYVKLAAPSINNSAPFKFGNKPLATKHTKVATSLGSMIFP